MLTCSPFQGWKVHEEKVAISGLVDCFDGVELRGDDFPVEGIEAGGIVARESVFT